VPTSPKRVHVCSPMVLYFSHSKDFGGQPLAAGAEPFKDNEMTSMDQAVRFATAVTVSSSSSATAAWSFPGAGAARLGRPAHRTGVGSWLGAFLAYRRPPNSAGRSPSARPEERPTPTTRRRRRQVAVAGCSPDSAGACELPPPELNHGGAPPREACQSRSIIVAVALARLEALSANWSHCVSRGLALIRPARSVPALPSGQTREWRATMAPPTPPLVRRGRARQV
jgi:hypothetical protein